MTSTEPYRFIAAIILAATDMMASFKGVSLALCLLMIAGAFQLYVGRYSLLVEEHGLPAQVPGI